MTTDVVSPKVQIRHFKVGEIPKSRDEPQLRDATDRLLPGDFILTHGDSWTDRLIQIGQRLRYWGADSRFCWWNHCALVASSEGAIIEALGRGVEENDISDYREAHRTLVRIETSGEDRAQEVAFARACIGRKYGFLTVLSLGISLLLGAKFSFGFNGQFICSGLVARALERKNEIFEDEPSHIMPATLAKLYGAEPPPPGTPKGRHRKMPRS